MPTPKHGYVIDGKKVPGVTSVIGRYKDSAKLIHWAWTCGIKHIDYRIESDSAAKIGTAAHDAIERTITKLEQVPNPVEHYQLPVGGMEKARRCFEAWKDWNSAVCPDYVVIEPKMVNALHGYGGTIDAVARIGDKLVLLDWKTSAAIYDDVAMQVAAYKQLWYENGGEHVDRCTVVRFDKKTGTFEQRSIVDTSDYFEQFISLLTAYKREKKIYPVKWDRMTKRELLKASQLLHKEDN